MPATLSDLSDSIETKIVRAIGAILRGGQFRDRGGNVSSDSFFAEAFRPILLIEAPTQRRLVNYAQGTLAIFAGTPKATGEPSDRTTLAVPVFILAYLPQENTSEDTRFNASNLGGRLRSVLSQAQRLEDGGGNDLTFATMDFRWVDAAIREGVFIAAYMATYETDISAVTGEPI